MYDLELLRKFCIVARYCSFTKAAEELFISQPALSKSIKQLEIQMDLELFKRNTKMVELTKQGSILYHLIYPRIEYICNIDSVIDSFKDKENVQLKIGSNATVTRNILTPILKEFLEIHTNIKLSIKNKSTYDMIDLLLKKELDLLIMNLPFKNTMGLDVTEIKEVQDILIASEKYKYLKDERLTLNQLQSLPIIINSKGSITRENFDDYCAKNNISITPHIETIRRSLIIDFCILGLGIGVTTYEFVQKEIEENNLFILNIDPPIPKRTVGIVTRNEPKTEVINDLINVLKK